MIRVAAAGALFLAVFFEPVATVVTGWTRRSQSFGIIIFGLFIYMLWARRSALREIPVRAEPLRGSVLLGAGCGMLVVGKAGSMIVLQEFAIIIAAMGLVWALWGRSCLKSVTFPLSYLVFTFPFFPALLGKHAAFFQNTSAFLAAKILSLGGMPVSREGEIITLPHVVLDVVRDCSGINHIIALMAISMPMAYFTLKSRWTKAGLVVSSFFIGIFANSMRIALIGVWTRFHPNADIHGPTSLLITSWFIMGFGLVLMVFAQLVFRKMEARDAGTTPSTVIRDTGLHFGAKTASNPLPVILSVLVATALVAHFTVPRRDARPVSLNLFPAAFGDWTGEDVAGAAEQFEEQDADLAVRRIYRGPSGSDIKVYLGYYSLQNEDKKIFNAWNEALESNSRGMTLSGAQGENLTILETRYRAGNGWRKAYYWYLVDGRIIADRYRLKLALIRNVLAHRRNSAAIVVVSRADADSRSGSAKSDFIRSFIQPATSASERLFSR